MPLYLSSLMFTILSIDIYSSNLSEWWPKDDSWVGFNLKNVSKSVNIHECLSQNYYLNSKPHPSAVELEMILCHFVQMHLIPSPDSSHNLLDMLRENSDGSAISCAIKYDCFCWISKYKYLWVSQYRSCKNRFSVSINPD